MVRATVEDVGQALGSQIAEWRERQIDAFNNVQFPEIERAGDSDWLKSMTWLNFGVDATQVLFPRSTAANIIAAATSKKYTVPLYLLGLAQDGFESLYDLIVDSHNRILEKRFEELRDEFVRHVQRVARGFRDSAYGRTCIAQIHAFIARREFRDGNQIDAYCQRLIHAANLVETDQATIRRLTNSGFEALCQKVFDIYRGMRRGPGSNEMWYASSPAESVWGPNGNTGPRYTRVRRESDEEWILANAWRMRTSHVDEPWISTRRDQTYVVRINDAQSPLHLGDTYQGETLDLAAAERRMAAE